MLIFLIAMLNERRVNPPFFLVGPAPQTTQISAGLTPGTTYGFLLRAYNGRGYTESSWSYIKVRMLGAMGFSLESFLPKLEGFGSRKLPLRPGWWFGCHFLFSHILGIIIPIDFHIFQRGSNHQPALRRFERCFDDFSGSNQIHSVDRTLPLAWLLLPHMLHEFRPLAWNLLGRLQVNLLRWHHPRRSHFSACLVLVKVMNIWAAATVFGHQMLKTIFLLVASCLTGLRAVWHSTLLFSDVVFSACRTLLLVAAPPLSWHQPQFHVTER